MEKKEKTNKFGFGVIVGVSLLLLVALIVVASYFRDFGKIKLSTNSKKIFSISDLKIDNIGFKSTENEVTRAFGNPNKTNEETIGIYKYKIMKYDGLTLTLKENYDDFILVKVEITSKKYTSSRNIKVGNKITKALRNYRIDKKEGAYLYGNYTKKTLSDSENKENIYFGIRSSKNLLYVNRDAVTEGFPTNIAKLDIEYSNGVIKKITWSYDNN